MHALRRQPKAVQRQAPDPPDVRTGAPGPILSQAGSDLVGAVKSRSMSDQAHHFPIPALAGVAVAAAVHPGGSPCTTALGMWTVHLVRA